jgi:hypothetical protein
MFFGMRIMLRQVLKSRLMNALFNRAGSSSAVRMSTLFQDVAIVYRLLGPLADRVRAETPELSEQVCPCIESLRLALDAEFDPLREDARGRKRVISSVDAVQAEVHRLKRQEYHQRSQRQAKENNLKTLEGRKLGARICNVWLLRAALAPPNLPARTVVEWARDFNLDEEQVIGYSSVGFVRDAFCEVLKEMNRQELVSAVSGLGASGSSRESLPIYITHVHDEALLRMRSYLQSGAHSQQGPRLCRSRHSKILNHVVGLHLGSAALDWHTELQPLSKKDASTIASALIVTCVEIMERCAQGLQLNAACDTFRCIHLVTGDAIGTNDAAARRVLFHVLELAAGLRMRYSLVVWVCSSHQSNLTVMIAVCGGVVRDPNVNDSICAACSRYYRHLMVDYGEEFAMALWAYLQTHVNLVFDSEDCDYSGTQRAKSLQRLYGVAVLPDDLLDVYNHGLGAPDRICSHGESRLVVCRLFYDILHKYCLVLDEKPITSRFWTFGACVNGLLRMRLLGIPDVVFQVSSVQPRKENQKRLDAFRRFHNDLESDQKLRIAALSLQLTLHATSITAQKQSNDVDREPSLLRLGKGEVQDKTSKHLVSLVPLLQADPQLDVGRALFSLMTTESHLLMRFHAYTEFPTALWQLCKEYNPDGYLIAIDDFLHLPAESLDVGYSFQLQREAWDKGDLAQATAHLLRDGVQKEVQNLILHGEGTSLDVERKHKLAKGAESVKVKSVPAASRNLIIQKYRAQRSQRIQQKSKNEAHLKQVKHMGIRSLAIQKNPGLFSRGRGRLWWEEEISKDSRRELTHIGDEQALQAYIEGNRSQLEAELSEMKNKARASVSETVATPYTNRQWLQWLDSNEQRFLELRKRATSDRRWLAKRLAPLASDMWAVPRLQSKVISPIHNALLAKLARQGAGFYLFASARRVFYVAPRWKDAWGCALAPGVHMCWCLDFNVPFKNAMKPFNHTMADYGLDSSDGDQEVCSLEVEFVGLEGSRATWQVLRAFVVEAPARRRRAAAASSDRADDSSDTEGSVEIEAGSDAISLSSCADSEVSEKKVDSGDESDCVVVDDALPAEFAKDAPGSHVFLRNDYFTLMNNPHFPDAKIQIHQKFCIPSELGTTAMSKTLVIEHYDPPGGEAMRTFLTLRSWMLWRVAKDGWAQAKPVRERWLLHEAQQLQCDVRALDVAGGGTGSAKADALIKKWWPQALA